MLLAFFIFEILYLSIWAPGVWTAKLSAVFAIIGVYTLSVKFLSSVKVFKENPEMLMENYFSPNPLLYWAANFIFFGLVFSLYGNSIQPERKAGYSYLLDVIGSIILLPLLPISFVYTLIHVLIVVPISYPAVLIVAALVHKVESSANDSEVSFSSGNIKFRLSRLVTDDITGHKLFLIGIPAIISSVFSSIAGLFID
jgi:uncharacterized membrane protein